ncbi:MAG: 1-acyl-sn-glycerol-3-phosphate acyltransferase [Chitinophagaceae bacterium]|jgi:1-acyl-sn-glycerol-3-phosphate acyltransferase|nr:1-acyl-sn-glycerol-3-phosphate acyltransferase [Chitinophagaceae bacterium]
MPFYKKILGRLWAIWGLVLFATTLLIFVWPITFTFLIKEPYGVRTFKALSKWWMTFFLYGIGCPMRVTGREHYDASKRYVVTANHQSLMDVPLLTPFFPGPNKTIAKRSMARIPLFGWIYARGSVLVDRGSDASRKRSYDAMKRVLLKEQLNMAVYPEGTRNRTGQPLKAFYDGAFRLAMDCRKDIIPVVILHTEKALPPAVPFFLWPTALEMHLLPAISSDGKTLGQLKEEVRSAMWDYIERNR